MGMAKCRGRRALSIHESNHSADSNKSEIVVVFDTEDTKRAKDFAASADLKEAMIKAGVLDTPTIYFLVFFSSRRRHTRSNEAARVHHAARRRGGGVAARGTRAAAGNAGDRLRQQ